MSSKREQTCLTRLSKSTAYAYGKKIPVLVLIEKMREEYLGCLFDHVFEEMLQSGDISPNDTDVQSSLEDKDA